MARNKRPIATLIKSCSEIMINLPGTKLSIFWLSKGEGTQKLNCKNNDPELCREEEIGQGWEGKHSFPSKFKNRMA